MSSRLDRVQQDLRRSFTGAPGCLRRTARPSSRKRPIPSQVGARCVEQHHAGLVPGGTFADLAAAGGRSRLGVEDVEGRRRNSVKSMSRLVLHHENRARQGVVPILQRVELIETSPHPPRSTAIGSGRSLFRCCATAGAGGDASASATLRIAAFRRRNPSVVPLLVGPRSPPHLIPAAAIFSREYSDPIRHAKALCPHGDRRGRGLRRARGLGNRSMVRRFRIAYSA